jgi:hypothetical protein
MPVAHLHCVWAWQGRVVEACWVPALCLLLIVSIGAGRPVVVVLAAAEFHLEGGAALVLGRLRPIRQDNTSTQREASSQPNQLQQSTKCKMT